MNHYRLHFLDHRGESTHALDLQCTDDEHAQRTVGTHRGDRALELWCGTRKVAYFLPSDEGPQTGS